MRFEKAAVGTQSCRMYRYTEGWPGNMETPAELKNAMPWCSQSLRCGSAAQRQKPRALKDVFIQTDIQLCGYASQHSPETTESIVGTCVYISVDSEFCRTSQQTRDPGKS